MPEPTPNPGKPRGHATRTATLVPGMVRRMLADAQHAREAGKKTAYTFICSAYDEIVRAL